MVGGCSARSLDSLHSDFLISSLNCRGIDGYFVGPDNYFSHAAGDAAEQRMAIATLIANRHVRVCEVETSLSESLAATSCDGPVGLMKSAVTRFEPCRDVNMGGLLAGLPPLCGNGLLSGLERHLSLPTGFYPPRSGTVRFQVLLNPFHPAFIDALGAPLAAGLRPAHLGIDRSCQSHVVADGYSPIFPQSVG